MNAKEQLKEVANKIDLEIEKILDQEYLKSKDIHPQIDSLLHDYRDLLAKGGKRLRGAFVYYGYKLAGGTNEDEILKAAAFIEIIHSYLLIHDDFMDRAELRRGYKTVNSDYSEKFRDRFSDEEQAKHFGNSIAVNFGDILSHLSLMIFSSLDFEPKLILEALILFNRKITDVGYGQVLDVFSEIEDVDEEYVLKVHKYKTGYYTYEAPLHIGAILAGANTDMREALTNYAIPGGIAFQLIDDIIDLYSTAEKTGKNEGQDIKEGKKTLLIIKAYENADESQNAHLDGCLGNKDITDIDIERIREIIKSTGSLDYSKTLSNNLLEESTEALGKLTEDAKQEAKDFLIGINKYMYHRIYDEDNNGAS